ncbi:hypothetical protein M8J75_005539 [Diaphorina citri]|nr:hypothetical protein M8J75_005539 [Diaphorina citri]
MANTNWRVGFTRAVCCVQIGLCLYAFAIRRAKIENLAYTSYCDISQRINCTGILTSRHVKGFGGMVGHILGESSPLNQPHQIYGVIFYFLQIPLSYLNSSTIPKLMLPLNLIAVLFSCYLVYLMSVVLGQICLLGLAVGLGNVLLVYATLDKIRTLDRGVEGGEKRALEYTNHNWLNPPSPTFISLLRHGKTRSHILREKTVVQGPKMVLDIHR